MCTTCTTDNATRYRHRLEMPLLAMSIMLWLVAVILGLSAIESFDSLVSETGGDLLFASLALLVAPLFIFVFRLFFAAQQRSNAAKVGPDQFPEIWNMYQEVVSDIGLPKAPSLYIINGNGVLNAYALSCTAHWKYIFLNAEIAMMLKDSPLFVRFVLAHELAHHKLGHVTLWRSVVGTAMNMLYLPGKALIRAQEYSADRLALALCPEAAESVLALTVGPFLAAQLNPEAFYRQIGEEEHGWMVRIANITSDHAVMSKRYKALRDIKAHGFEVHGEMF